MRQRPKRFLSTAVAIGLMIACPAPAADTVSRLPGQGVVVRTGVGPLAEETFQAEIVNIGLERLGYRPAPILHMTYPLLVTALATGDADLMPVFVEPNFTPLFVKAGGDAKLRKVGDLWHEVSGFRIDKRTADRYHITNIGQLKDPAIAALFDSDGDGKADLVGCDPGWSCEPLIERQMDAYGLRNTVTVKKGNYAALIADTLARHQDRKPILYFAWEPFWLGEVLKTDRDVVWLEVPFTTYPPEAGTITAEETDLNGRNLGYAHGHCRVLGGKTFLDHNPPAARFLSVLRIPTEDLLRESYRIKQGEDKPENLRKHAEQWIVAHQTLFDGWLAEAGMAAGAGTTGGPTPGARGVLQSVLNPFSLYTFRLDTAITSSVDSAAKTLRPFLQIFRGPVAWVLLQVRSLLLAAPPLAVLILVSLLAWRVSGVGVGIFSLLSLTLIGFVGLWEPAMVSCAIVVTAVMFCIAAGIPLGVVCARNDRIERVARPLLDAMQTLPTLVYLVPVVMLFGIGEVPGVIATIIYALPPLVRFTNLGIRQVSGEAVEAASAFGSTRSQILWEVQIPLALPTIMAGVNQTLLFALGMTVIASMIAVPGLGLIILQGVGRLDVGGAAVGGLAIVLLAILLDRTAQGIQKVMREKEAGH